MDANEIDVERVKLLARRVANAAMLSWQDVFDAIMRCVQRNELHKIDGVREQLAKIHESIPKKLKGRTWGWYTNSPERRELVTRPSPRILIVSAKRSSRRRYRRIRRRMRFPRRA